MRQRLAVTMPLIALTLFLFSGFVLENWLLGLSAFLLIPLSSILLSKHWVKRIHQLMPLIALIIFLWLAFGLDMAHPGWIVFFLIPLSDIVFSRAIDGRKLVTIGITITYLILGFTLDNFWHPGWLMFLLIPIINNLFFPNRNQFIFMNKEDIKSRVRRFVDDDDDEEEIIL